MTRPITDTFHIIQLIAALCMGLVMSGTATPARSQPAFLNRPVQATFQRIPLARLVSKLSIISDGIIILDHQIDPTQHITLACQGESLRTVLWRLADETETEIAVLESSVWITPFGKASQLEQADRNRQRTLRQLPATTQKQLSTQRPLQWPLCAELLLCRRRQLSKSALTVSICLLKLAGLAKGCDPDA